MPFCRNLYQKKRRCFLNCLNMMCRPGQLCSITIFEFNCILAQISPWTNTAPRRDWIRFWYGCLGLKNETPCVLQDLGCTMVFLPLWSSWPGRSGQMPQPRHTGVDGLGIGCRAAEPEQHPAFPDTHCWVTSGRSALLWRAKRERLTWWL